MMSHRSCPTNRQSAAASIVAVLSRPFVFVSILDALKQNLNQNQKRCQVLTIIQSNSTQVAPST